MSNKHELKLSVGELVKATKDGFNHGVSCLADILLENGVIDEDQHRDIQDNVTESLTVNRKGNEE